MGWGLNHVAVEQMVELPRALAQRVNSTMAMELMRISHGGQVGPQGLVGQHLGDIGTSVGDVRALDRGQEAITSSWGRSHERSEEGE